MTTERKYTGIRVLHEVYCSSTSDYTFRCVCNFGRFNYMPELAYPAEIKGKNGLWIQWRAPKYVCQEVERQIAEMAETNQFKVYEYDRDRNKRYTDLRYHDPEFFKSWIASWKIEGD